MARPATSRSAISQLPGPGPMMATPSRSPAVSSWSRSGLGDAGSGRDARLMRRTSATGGELVVVLIALAGFDQADTRTTPISLCHEDRTPRELEMQTHFFVTSRRAALQLDPMDLKDKPTRRICSVAD